MQNPRHLLALICALCWSAAGLQAQTVLNVPPDILPNNAVIQPNTVVNILPGGAAGGSIKTEILPAEPNNITINILGGSIGDNLLLNNGVDLVVESGTVGDDLFANDGSVVTVRGGAVGSQFYSFSGSEVRISGGHVGNSGYSESSEFFISGGEVGNSFRFINALLSISDGKLGDNAEVGGQLTVSGGQVGSQLLARSFATVDISGGAIGERFRAWSDNTVSISGGSIGDQFRAGDRTQLTITGGTIGNDFTIDPGSEVDIYGGNFGRGFLNQINTAVRFHGSEFQINGQPAVSPVTVRSNDVFTGTLADGSVFIFSGRRFDFPQGVELIETPLSPVEPSPISVNSDQGPLGIRAGQQVTLFPGGSLGRNAGAVDGHLRVEGGQVGPGLEVLRTSVTVTDGAIGSYFTALTGTQIDLSGGEIGEILELGTDASLVQTGGSVGRFSSARWGGRYTLYDGSVGDDFTARDGAQVSVHGGSFGDRFKAHRDSNIVITGGRFGTEFEARSLSNVEISGGVFGRVFSAAQATTRLLGGEFMLNGQPLPAGQVTLQDGDLFTGVLSDGSPFAFGGFVGLFDVLNEVTLVESPVPPASTEMIEVTGASPVNGLRPNESLTLSGEGLLPEDFAVLEAELTTLGGAAGERLEAIGATLNLNGGIFGNHLTVTHGTQLAINGAEIGNDLTITNQSQASLQNGSVADGAVLTRESSWTVTGGEVGNDLIVQFGSQLDVYGGTIGWDAFVGSDATLNLFGGETGIRLTTSRDGTTNVWGGTIGPNSVATTDGVVNVYSGSVGRRFEARSGSSVNIHGGSIADEFSARRDSQVTVTGGEFDGSFSAGGASDVRIAGGTVGNEFRATSDALVHLFVTEISLDGETFPLDVNTTSLITQRDMDLEGFFADGSPFLFQLNANFVDGESWFQESVELVVTRIRPGDFQGDGDIDIADLLAWQRGDTFYPVGPDAVSVWSIAAAADPTADIDLDGDVDLADLAAIQRVGGAPDLQIWLSEFGLGAALAGGSGPIPEPSSLLLATLALAGMASPTSRRNFLKLG